MVDNTQQQPAAPAAPNLLDNVSLNAFDQLARRFGYVLRVEVDAQWNKAMGEVMAMKAADALKATKQADAPPQDNKLDTPAEETAPAQHRRPGRKPNAEKAAAAAQQVAEPMENPKVGGKSGPDTPPAKPASLELKAEPQDEGKPLMTTDARAALTTLVAATDVGTGMKLLQDEFGVKKVSDVPVDKIATFIARCDALAGAGNKVAA